MRMRVLKCSKCGNVFERDLSAGAILGSIHLGPYHRLKCPACGRKSFFNIYASVKEPVTWPPQKSPHIESQLTREKSEEKRIEESKYERA